jgi:hypothetical protein
MERGTLALLGALIVVVVALGKSAGCGFEETGNVSASPEEVDEIVVRVSGNLGEEGAPQIIEDTLGDEPTEYEVEIEEGVADGMSAFFEKTKPGSSGLEAEILADAKP